MTVPTTPPAPKPPHHPPSLTAPPSTQDTPTRDTPTQDTPTQDTPTQDTPRGAGTVGPLDDVARLLRQAALAAWEIGDREGLTSEMHHLGLGAYLALGNTVALLATGDVAPHNSPLVGLPAENDPARLVGSAETRLRALAPEATPGLSDLVLEVCDLTREFQQLAPAQRS